MNATRKRASIEFVYRGAPGQQVFVAGTFNGWNPQKHQLQEISPGEYVRRLRLPPGRHEYKYIVDGVWVPDTENPDSVSNVHGTRNSVVTA